MNIERDRKNQSDGVIVIDETSRLISLSCNDGKEIYNFLQTIGKKENGFKNEVYGMNFEEYQEWLKQQVDWANGRNLPDGYVPQTIYWLYVGGIPVGYGKIRWGLTESSRNVGGNIGCAIGSENRGKGYGKILLNALLKIMRRSGLQEMLATVEKPNYASKAIVENCGGTLIRENDERWFFEFSCEEE